MTKRTHRKGGSNRMMQTGPYLSAALFVEKILNEDERRVPSLIRVVDRLLLPVEPPKGELIGFHDLVLFISIKAGSFSGECGISIYQVDPDAKIADESAIGAMTIAFPKNAPIAGINIHAPVALKWNGAGLYYFEIRLDSVPFARAGVSVSVGPTMPPLAENEKASVKGGNK